MHAWSVSISGGAQESLSAGTICSSAFISGGKSWFQDLPEDVEIDGIVAVLRRLRSATI